MEAAGNWRRPLLVPRRTPSQQSALRLTSELTPFPTGKIFRATVGCQPDVAQPSLTEDCPSSEVHGIGKRESELTAESPPNVAHEA